MCICFFAFLYVVCWLAIFPVNLFITLYVLVSGFFSILYGIYNMWAENIILYMPFLLMSLPSLAPSILHSDSTQPFYIHPLNHFLSPVRSDLRLFNFRRRGLVTQRDKGIRWGWGRVTLHGYMDVFEMVISTFM